MKGNTKLLQRLNAIQKKIKAIQDEIKAKDNNNVQLIQIILNQIKNMIAILEEKEEEKNESKTIRIYFEEYYTCTVQDEEQARNLQLCANRIMEFYKKCIDDKSLPDNIITGNLNIINDIVLPEKPAKPREPIKAKPPEEIEGEVEATYNIKPREGDVKRTDPEEAKKLLERIINNMLRETSDNPRETGTVVTETSEKRAKWTTVLQEGINYDGSQQPENGEENPNIPQNDQPMTQSEEECI